MLDLKMRHNDCMHNRAAQGLCGEEQQVSYTKIFPRITTSIYLSWCLYFYLYLYIFLSFYQSIYHSGLRLYQSINQSINRGFLWGSMGMWVHSSEEAIHILYIFHLIYTWWTENLDNSQPKHNYNFIDSFVDFCVWWFALGQIGWTY